MSAFPFWPRCALNHQRSDASRGRASEGRRYQPTGSERRVELSGTEVASEGVGCARSQRRACRAKSVIDLDIEDNSILHQRLI